MLTAEQIQEAKALLEAQAANNANGNGNGHTLGSGWAAPAPVATFMIPQAAPSGAGPEKVLVPIKVQTPNGGSLRVYFVFPGEAAANPQTLMNFLGQLAAAGIPLDVYQPKNGWGGRGNGGGWGQQRGGW